MSRTVLNKNFLISPSGFNFVVNPRPVYTVEEVAGIRLVLIMTDVSVVVIPGPRSYPFRSLLTCVPPDKSFESEVGNVRN